MISNGEVLDAVPQAGAERAAAVFQMMKDQGFVMAAARALLAYSEWLAEQSCEMRMETAINTERLVRQIRESRAKFRESVGK